MLVVLARWDPICAFGHAFTVSSDTTEAATAAVVSATAVLLRHVLPDLPCPQGNSPAGFALVSFVQDRTTFEDDLTGYLNMVNKPGPRLVRSTKPELGP